MRLESVVDRVVAWHNRHPLAERITREQVQGVGLVRLPYAWRGGELRPATDPVAEVPPEAAAGDGGDARAPAAKQGEGDATEAAIAGTAGATAAEPAPADAGPARSAAVDAASAGIGADAGATAAPANEPSAPASVPRPRFAASPPWPPPRWWQRPRTPRLPLRALFSEDFVAPIRPRRIAAWAARHGVAEPPLPAGVPERVVSPDVARRLPEGEAVEADLYLITAAVVVGDRRHRVLLAPRTPGAVIGPRHWSRRRGAAVISGLAALSLAAFGAGGLRGGTAAPAIAAVPQVAQAMVRLAEPVEPVSPAPAAAPLEAAVAAAAPSDHPAGERPLDIDPRRGQVEMPFAKPRLPPEDRQRVQAMSASLRRQGMVPAGAARGMPQAAVKLYALVSASTRERGSSEHFARQLQVLAQLRPGVLRAELMQVGNGWRAVCWPFSSAQEAERVRLALADRGLKTEVVEF